MRDMLTVSRAILRGFSRDKTGLFFTVAFPLVFLFIMGGLFGGGVVQSRLMVSDDDIEMARHVLEQAGLGPET